MLEYSQYIVAMEANGVVYRNKVQVSSSFYMYMYVGSVYVHVNGEPQRLNYTYMYI